MRFGRTLNVLKHPIKEISVQTAKRRHRKQFPECAICGVKPTFFGRNNDVHHFDPVHLFLALATAALNLVTLCRHCHWLFGHFKNWKDYHGDLRKNIPALRRMYKEMMENSCVKG